MRTYTYVGPREILNSIGHSTTRKHIAGANDFLLWLDETQQLLNPDNEVVVTFIISEAGAVWIADRHSEHVVCADGHPVLSAGEMTFCVTEKEVSIAQVSNQSTGYCPEPESWPNVAQALDLVGLRHSNHFTSKFIFRSCTSCNSINIIKEDWFVCAVCDADLDMEWNFEK